MHVEDFAIRRQAAVEIVAIPGRDTFSAVIDVLFRHISAAGDHIRLADAIGTAALWHRITGTDDARAGGDAVFRIDLARAIRQRQAGNDRHTTARNLSDSPLVPPSPHSTPVCRTQVPQARLAVMLAAETF